MRVFALLALAPLVLALLTLPVATAAYEGPLFDSHAHLDDRALAGALGARMEAHGVERGVLFVGVDPEDVEGSWEELGETLQGQDGRFVLFFHVDPKAPSDLDPARLDRVVDEHGADLRGFGEMAFYRPPWQGTTMDAAPWPDVLAWAGRRNVTVMVHPMPGMYDSLERALEAHRETRVLIHGFESPERFAAMLEAHPNLYVTIDTSTLLVSEGMPILYPQGGEAEFTAKFDARRADLLASALARWSPAVEAAPERVMWGTDVAFDWHAREATYGRLVGFSRDFIAALPEDARAGYAHDNAARLLGEGVSIPHDEAPAPGLAVVLVGVAVLALARRRR